MTSADFAAAQARIAERRHLQQQHHESHRQLQQQQVDASSLAYLPAPLRQLCTSTLSQWDIIGSRFGTQPAFRVGQVDAELLDEELLELLKGQVDEALKYYGQHLRNDWHAEIQLALRSILFKLTIWDHDASYGAALQNLRYTDARNVGAGMVPEAAKKWQKGLYGLISVGGRYAWGRWNDYLLDVESDYDEPSARMKLLSRITNLASTTHSIAAFASFLIFLLNGRYRTLLDRILRLRLTPTTTQGRREVSFEYLNRQLVWHAFTEFLLFLLPLVGISRWRRWIERAWRKTKTTMFPSAHGEEEDARAGGELGFLPDRTCAICYQDQNPTSASENEVAALSAGSGGVVGSAATDVTNPYETVPCGCLYCFVCIAQRLEGEDNEEWTCLRCGELVKECRPWSGDVLVEQGKKDRTKSSSSASGSQKGSKRVSFLDDPEAEAETVKSPETEADDVGEDSVFQEVDPMPMDDEKAAAVRAAVEGDVEMRRGSSLEESGEWSKVGVETTPQLGPSEDAEADGDTDASTLDFGGFDAGGALVDDDIDEAHE